MKYKSIRPKHLGRKIVVCYSGTKHINLSTIYNNPCGLCTRGILSLMNPQYPKHRYKYGMLCECGCGVIFCINGKGMNLYIIKD